MDIGIGNPKQSLKGSVGMEVGGLEEDAVRMEGKDKEHEWGKEIGKQPVDTSQTAQWAGRPKPDKQESGDP